MWLAWSQPSAGASLLPGIALLAASLAGGAPLDEPYPIPIEEVHRYAAPFVNEQKPDGAYQLSTRVQAHEKAEIAMGLAADAAQTPIYAQSAWRDMEWVIATHLEPGGGLNWDGPNNPYFFECHQHWFLISSEQLRRQIGTPEEMKQTQLAVWRFLTETNPAGADFYLHNHENYGPFFAYRSVNRLGQFQTQAPYKGSYEIGTALWSLSLIKDLPWMQEASQVERSAGLTLPEYLYYLVVQVSQSAIALGWQDPANGCWVRSLIWNSPGWLGWEATDWKYALDTQEGALLYKILTGGSELDDPIRRQSERLVGFVQPDGSIATLPDAFGTPQYEYGAAMCVLALTATAFIEEDPGFAVECYNAAGTVANYVVQSLEPESSEDGSLLLRGISRIVQMQAALGGSVAGLADLGTSAAARDAELRIWPNPMSDHATVGFALPPRSIGLLSISDVTGRRVGSFPVRTLDMAGGSYAWDGRDRAGRPLPAGSYRIVLESEQGERSGGVVIVR